MIIRSRHHFAALLPAFLAAQPGGCTGLPHILRRLAGPAATDRERVELDAAVRALAERGAVALEPAGLALTVRLAS